MLNPPKPGITGTRAITHFGAGGAALPCARLTGRGYGSPGMEDRRIWEAGRRATGRRGLDVGGFSLQSQSGLQPTLSWGSRLTSLLRRPVTRALPFMARCHFSSFENVPGRKQGQGSALRCPRSQQFQFLSLHCSYSSGTLLFQGFVGLSFQPSPDCRSQKLRVLT